MPFKNTVQTLSVSLLIFFFNSVAAQVVINEFSCSNKDAYTDNFGEYEDWIELYNSGTASADISGFFCPIKGEIGVSGPFLPVQLFLPGHTSGFLLRLRTSLHLKFIPIIRSLR